jgi:hypothetical protein
MLRPEDILEVVRAVELPAGWGYSCLGTCDRPMLAICVPEDGLYQIELVNEREGAAYTAEIVVDAMETTPEELASLIRAKVARLRAEIDRVHPRPA